MTNKAELTSGQWYHIDWTHKNEQHSDYMQFMYYEHGMYFFRAKGDWLPVKECKLINNRVKVTRL